MLNFRKFEIQLFKNTYEPWCYITSEVFKILNF